MNRKLSRFLALALLFCFATPLRAQPTPTDPADAGIDKLREAIKSAYNKGDIDAMTQFIHPDCVIIFPDGQILNGPQGLRDYINKMLNAPDHIVKSYNAEPAVKSRTIHNDVALSYGEMNDRYVLTDGKTFGLNSRFTITLLKSPAGPSQSDGWMVRSFHSSADAFDNPVTQLKVKAYALTASGGALVLGIAIGWILVRIVTRKSKPKPAV